MGSIHTKNIENGDKSLLLYKYFLGCRILTRAKLKQKFSEIFIQKIYSRHSKKYLYK